MSELVELEDRVLRMMDRFEGKLDSLSEHVREIREAQIRLDANNNTGAREKLEDKMVTLEARMILLEAKRAEQTGFMQALEWLYKLGPWLFITALAVVSYWRGWIG